MNTNAIALDTLWILVCSFLVFFMNTGFGCIEAGLCRSKNTVNILAKNFIVFGIASLGYWALGFALMFGSGTSLMGTSGFFFSDDLYNTTSSIFSALDWSVAPLLAKFFFQLAFAATAATIVSGCVAERIHFGAFIIFASLLATLFYPITGHWVWGGGWLGSLGAWDFAGSTVVHSVGGWAGLAGILVLGPRIGKYDKNGGIHPIPGHSMPLTFLGGMILWLGWFGFNPGSTMAISGDSAGLVTHIVVTTNLACAAAILTSTLTSYLTSKKPDFSMTVNGALAGLVGITAGCAFVSLGSAIMIGAIAGIIVVYGVKLFDAIKIDDPVGALSVHLLCGVWGTLAVGLFGSSDIPGGLPTSGLFVSGDTTLLFNQMIMICTVGGFTFGVSYLSWLALDRAIGIRVSPQVEAEGLDIHEMGMESYPSEAPIINVQSLVEESHLGKKTTKRLLKDGESLRASLIPEAYPKDELISFELQIKHGSAKQLIEQLRTLSGSGHKESEKAKRVLKRFTTVHNNVIRFSNDSPEEVTSLIQELLHNLSPRSTVELIVEKDTEMGAFNSHMEIGIR